MALVVLGVLGGAAVGGLGGWALGGFAGAALGGIAGAALGGALGAAASYQCYYYPYRPLYFNRYYYQPSYPVAMPYVYQQYPMQWFPAPAFGYW